MKLAAIILAVFLFADTPIPTISDAVKARFFKAQAQMIDANARLQQSKEYQDAQTKQKSFSDAVQELTKACGNGFNPEWDAMGDPICVIAPKPAAAPIPAKKP
jgi:hypothetical protein